MYQEIKPERFDPNANKWILEIVMTNGYVQVIKFQNPQSLNNYRNEFIAFANQKTLGR